ncbi:cell division protein CrgA [Psychromicrobium xiongbiense]|uniref:cell division protein CrgA n=1 Tax=Psychromicrobium xiongbiense TaxID=3051184 RepID=UPI002556FFF8|nr:cell division protein CrgA [Psychromicrobium sp. YIM S02556]
MPESKSRRRTRSAETSQQSSKAIKPNPVWFKPVMFGLMILGLLWIIVYYITSMSPGGSWPVPSLGAWNIAIGFGIVIIGFLMTTRWRS